MTTYGRDAVPLLLRRQTDFLTAASGAFVSLPCYRNTVGSTRPLYDDKTLGQGRDPGEKFLGFETHDGEIEAPFTSESLGWHLHALLGAPTTTGSGPYTHVFRSGGAMSWHTLGRTVGGVHFRDIGVAWNEMRVGLRRQSETQRAVFGVLGRSEEKLGATVDADPVAPAASDARFFAFDGALTLDGSPVADIVDVDLAVSNNRTHDDEALSGDPWPLRLLEGDFMVSGTARFRFESAARYDAARSGASFDLGLAWAGAGGHSLTLTVSNVKFTGSRVPLESGGVLSLSLPFEAARPADGEACLTATLVNGLAGYGNPA